MLMMKAAAEGLVLQKNTFNFEIAEKPADNQKW
jgi:hypothetical protein